MHINTILADLETVADDTAAAPAGDQSSASADTAAGAATGGDVGAATAAEPAAPAAPQIDWNSPDARQAMEGFLQEREQAAWEAQQAEHAREQEAGQFSDVEEALELLGVAPDRFGKYLEARLGPQVAPMQEIAQQFAERQAVEMVTGMLGQVGQQHPDLLGEGVDKLAEFVNDEGQPVFQPDEVRQLNTQAVLFGAAALKQAFPQLDEGTAISQAVSAIQQRDEIQRRIGAETYRRQLQTAGTAASDVTSGGQGAQTITGVEGGDEAAFARRWMAENR